METLKLIAAIVAIFLILPLLVVLLKDKLFNRPRTKEEIAEFSRRFNERLLHPDFAAVEAHFGCSMPEELKRLYSAREEILCGDFEVASKGKSKSNWYVAYYNPADAESLNDYWPAIKNFFAFANDGCGNDYLIDPRDPELKVVFHDHETGEIEPVDMSFPAFLAAPRKQITG